MENRTSFGRNAGAYREFRPTYPESLYAWLAGQCKKRAAALDCATGNGQAALGLVRHFDRVVATDTDQAQIASAPVHDKIEYRIVAAEELSADLGPFNLVTAAQGAHWFDLEVFYDRLKTVLAPGAIIAIWGYAFPRIAPAIDVLVRKYIVDVVDPYWALGNRIIMDHYRTIPFPWEEIAPPSFIIREDWDRSQFLGFVRTWSAYKRLVAELSHDPLEEFTQELDKQGLWPASIRLPVEFDIHSRVGRESG